MKEAQKIYGKILLANAHMELLKNIVTTKDNPTIVLDAKISQEDGDELLKTCTANEILAKDIVNCFYFEMTSCVVIIEKL